MNQKTQEVAKKKRKKRMRLPNGMGSVHRINDGKSRRKPWRARVPVGVDFNEATGKATQKYIVVGYFENELDAIQALMDYRKDPYTLEAATCTFADVYDMWKAKKFPTISPGSQNSYKSQFNNSAVLHKMKMREIRTNHMEAIIDATDSGFEVQSKLKTFWGQLFKYAIEHDIVQKNYAEYVKLKDKAKTTSRTAISNEDIYKIWDAATAGDPDAQIAMIYIYTGFRAMELLEAKKENVSIDDRIIIGGLKTDAGRDRHVPLHTCIMPFVERLMATDGDYLIMRYDKKEPALFTYHRFAKYHWQPMLERLGITENYTLHYTRHTCATILREANIEDDIRKLILGHASKDITDRYTHHPDYMLVQAIDKVPIRQRENE